MTRRNIIAFVLILVSFGLLFPGLTFDLITIRASIEAFGVTQQIFLGTGQPRKNKWHDQAPLPPPL